MRTSVVGTGVAVLTLGWAAQVAGQGLVFDARRVGMGGLALGRSSSLVRYNVAYRAVPANSGRHGEPKVTIPIPLGLIQFFHDHPNITKDPAFNPDSTGFNPILVVNTLLTLPIYYEVKQAPTPTNDVIFGIGRDSLRANLGAAAQIVPEDQFGIGGSSRPLDPGIGIRGVRLSVMGWLHDEVGFQLGDNLLGFLRDSQPASANSATQPARHQPLRCPHALIARWICRRIPWRFPGSADTQRGCTAGCGCSARSRRSFGT